MTYTNKLGKEYQLWKHDVILRGGKTSSIYFYLPINQKPTRGKYGEPKKLDFLPDTHEVKEIGKSYTPLVNKKRSNQ